MICVIWKRTCVNNFRKKIFIVKRQPWYWPICYFVRTNSKHFNILIIMTDCQYPCESLRRTRSCRIARDIIALSEICDKKRVLESSWICLGICTWIEIDGFTLRVKWDTRYRRAQVIKNRRIEDFCISKHGLKQ